MTFFDLELRGPLHLGEFVGINRESALDWIPSDSLLAAIATAWSRQLSPREVEARLDACRPVNGSSLQLTSAFPRAGDVRFFPALVHWPTCSGLSGSGKAAKRIRWMSYGVWEALAQGLAPEGRFIQGNTVWLTDAEWKRCGALAQFDAQGDPGFWSPQVVPHATIDRLSGAANLFHTGRVIYADGCGLWFGVRGRSDWAAEALAMLEGSGLGGLRSTGHGAFSVTRRDNLDLPPATTSRMWLLSRWAPASDEEFASLRQAGSAYRLVTVGGWCVDETGRHWRRRATRLIAEGAILASAVRGTLIDVTPATMERKIYRSGLAFGVSAGQLAEEQAHEVLSHL